MIVIDYSDKRPIYEQVVERFRMLILNGVFESNEKLPSVRTLAVELSINPNTIQRAYAELEREGFIYSIKGKGNFVNDNAYILKLEKDKLLNELRNRMEKCKEAGILRREICKCLEDVFGEVEV